MGNDILVFESSSGLVWIGERSPLTLFQLFWDDEMFEFIKNMTNENALLKRRGNPEKHKTKLREISVEEIETFLESV